MTQPEGLWLTAHLAVGLRHFAAHPDAVWRDLFLGILLICSYIENLLQPINAYGYRENLLRFVRDKHDGDIT